MKKALSMLLGTAMLVSLLAACGAGTSSVADEAAAPESTAAESVAAEEPEATEPEDTDGDEEDAQEETPAPTGDVFEIGIVQLVEHGALDQAYQGFVDGLAEAGYVDGENINIDYQNAQGEQSNASTIASKFVNDDKDLIFAIATPAAQAVVNATQDIPVLFSAVTDAEGAGLVASNDAPGGNVTGTSDLTAVREQIELLTQMFPEAQTVGVLYNSGEDNARIQMEMTAAACEEFGLAYEEYTVSNSNDVQQVAQSMVGKVDVLYAFTDNTIASTMTTVAMVANENLLPTVVGEESMVTAGGLVSLSISYYELGRITAEMAIEILVNGANPAEMPVRYQTSDLSFEWNEETAELLGVEKPE